MTEIRRKLYRRGSSYETTIPMPLLFALDLSKKHNVVFIYSKESNGWYLRFEEATEKAAEKTGKGKKKEDNQ